MFKVDEPGTPFDHLMRAVQFHHVQLSSMADMKANMLLTMSSVVLTLCLPQVVRNNHLWPLYISDFILPADHLPRGLCGDAQTAARPTSRHPIRRTPRLTFSFGDFTRLTQAQFENAMEELMNDPSLSMARRCARFTCWAPFSQKRNTAFCAWATSRL